MHLELWPKRAIPLIFGMMDNAEAVIDGNDAGATLGGVRVAV